jgi:hypothetical protein
MINRGWCFKLLTLAPIQKWLCEVKLLFLPTFLLGILFVFHSIYSVGFPNLLPYPFMKIELHCHLARSWANDICFNVIFFPNFRL